MRRTRTLALSLAGAGLYAVSLMGAAYFGEAPPPGLEPIIVSGGPMCLAGGQDGGALLRYYARIAAQAEGGGFPPPTPVPAADYASAIPPLWDNLGGLHYPVSTAVPLAQRYFDQGLRLAYAFNHAEARRAFRAAQAFDPECAMCYWGEALVLGPNLNAPMAPAHRAPALAALERARALAGAHASDKERALIDALAARYAAAPGARRDALDAAYAEAMGRVAARFPDDPDIQTLYAEALLDLSPWDYWAAGGSRPKGRTAEIVAVLEAVLRRAPDHPGAIHYYIHAVEASTRPERAEPHAERLAAAMPGAGHLVHMPFHIYFRVGRYKDALAANMAAVAADEDYLAQVRPEGLYPLAYYPHNVHALMASAQMAGDGQTAIAAAHKVGGIVCDETARQMPLVQPIKAAPYFAHAQFSRPEVILGLPAPAAGMPFVEAMWRYARGVAQAAGGRPRAAEAEAAAIARLKDAADFSGLEQAGIPARELLELARQVVLGRAAQARRHLGAARRAFARAVELEDALPYMEPPYWYYPVRQSLGAVLLQAGRAREAEAAFRASLARMPNNGWALYGLGQAYRRMGDDKSAAAVEELLDAAWAGDKRALHLDRL